MSRRYYADAALFVWLRNKVFRLEKPYALGWGEWDIWKENTKRARPFAYFFCETLPDILEKPAEYFIDPIDDLVYYLRNRLVRKTHYLRTGLAPGKWYDFGTRLLHGSFTELVDFVEVEKAWHMVAVSFSSNDTRNKYGFKWYHNYNWLRWRRYRCAAAGIDHLKWEMTLDDEKLSAAEQSMTQAQAARETMLLYTWWTKTRANRKDEWDETGLRAFWETMDEKYGSNWLGLSGKSKLSSFEQTEYRRLSDAASQLEKDRLEEDDQMLVRLVKVRSYMWT